MGWTRVSGLEGWSSVIELIKKAGPWKTLADVELATAGYIDWYNSRWLHTAIGGIPPAEHEAVSYAQTQPATEAGPDH